MRFLHIADLHLGKQMNDLLLLDDQEAVLDQIIHIANDEKVDAVLIAGDVYQRTTPQAEAMALFDRFVSRLVDDGRKIFVISGNHDSALRISYFSSLVKNAGVYVTETFNGELQHVTLHDTDGDLNVWMMPFLRPAHVKRALPDEKITSYQDAVAAVIRHADIDFSKRNLLICHQFIVGCTTCDSEELSIGTLDHIDGTVFDGFDYVALGHIHGPQNVLRDTMRYAGSPLKYSFSEAAHHKSVTIVDMQEKGETMKSSRAKNLWISVCLKIIRRSWMQRRKRLMPMKKQLQEKSASMKTFTRKFKMHSASASARRNTGQLSATSTIVVPARLEVTVAPS